MSRPIQDRQDVGMLQLRRERDLPTKAFGAQRLGELRMQHFERNRASVLQVLREIDSCHPAAANLAIDRVLRRESLSQSVEQIALGHNSSCSSRGQQEDMGRSGKG